MKNISFTDTASYNNLIEGAAKVECELLSVSSHKSLAYLL